MTDTEPSTPAATPAPKKRSPAVVAAIIIVVVLVLVGGGLVIYKLTKSKDEPQPSLKVAKAVIAAVQNGNTAVIRSDSTGQGTTQLLAIKPNDVGGMTLTAASCTKVANRSRVCTASRPGGALTMRLVFTDGAWRVSTATLGAAGLPPSSTTTTT